ncbi:MAG: TIGR03086 family protein [Acidimicrobiales bacterium]|nr:TIGR03086 family protein [Acidimicrobiales bacterium]
MGPGDIWKQAAAHFDQNLKAVGDDQWDLPTPCEGWSVRELVDHAVQAQAGIGSVLGSAAAPDASWDDVYPAVSAAIDDPSNLEGNAPPQVMGGMPKHQLLGIAVGDVLLHSWDLARATGGDENLPPAAVEAVQMGLGRMPEQMLRSPKMFANPVEVADDASAQDKLLGFTGRQP